MVKKCPQYCRNCVFYKPATYGEMGGGEEYCDVFWWHPLLAIKTRDHVGRYITLPTVEAKVLLAERSIELDGNYLGDLKFQLNKDFACEFYETKWWKFWVKVEERHGEGIEGKGNSSPDQEVKGAGEQS